MQFFIDTANLDQIKEAQALGILDGVTTNPSLMAKEGIAGEENVMKHYKAICNIVEDKVSAEVIATDYEGMIAEGEKLAAIDPKIVVKIPMVKDGIKALKYFSKKYNLPFATIEKVHPRIENINYRSTVNQDVKASLITNKFYLRKIKKSYKLYDKLIYKISIDKTGIYNNGI